MDNTPTTNESVAVCREQQKPLRNYDRYKTYDRVALLNSRGRRREMKNYEPWPRRKGDCDFIKRSWDMLGVSIACYKGATNG